MATDVNPYLRAVSAGLASGMRASSAATAITLAAHAGNLRLDNPTLSRFAAKRPVAVLAGVGAVTELVIDKLPMTPSRLANGGWTVRVALGAITGGLVARARGGKPLLGAAVGAAAAGATTVGGYEARTRIVPAAGVPDLFIALAEDGLALALAAISVGPVPKQSS